MKKLLWSAMGLFMIPFLLPAQECSWSGPDESHDIMTTGFTGCGNGLDAFIPEPGDSALTVRLVLVIWKDQNGNSPFSNNQTQDSISFYSAIQAVNTSHFSNFPGPSVPNPSPTVNLSDTYIRFEVARVLYAQANSTGSNMTFPDAFNNLPEKFKKGYIIVNYASWLYKGLTPKPNIWGEARSWRYIEMWEQSNFNATHLLSHELGHSLGLDHTFNTNMWGDGDKINDTPLDILALSSTVCDPAPAGCSCPPITPYPGNVCPNNVMGYNNQEWWSPRQIATMRKHLLLETPDIISNKISLGTIPTDYLEITTNTIWDNERFLYKNLRVKSGVTLTINGTLILGKDALIEVEAGAELVLDCAYLSAGGAYLWGGIRLLGDNTKPQNTQDQSKLTATNSIIARAEDAVMNGTIYGGAVLPSGAIISVSDCSFLNNLRDVAMVKYNDAEFAGVWFADWADYQAEFTNVDFKNDHYFETYGHYRGASVSLWGVHGVVFNNCRVLQFSLYRDLPGVPNEAIFMLDASIKMNGGRIDYFPYGIRSFSTKSTLIGSAISGVRLNSNRYGIYLGGAQMHKVVNNTFFVPRDVPGTAGLGGQVDLPYGLYFHTSGLIRAEENKFLQAISNQYDYSSDPSATHIGLVVYNNGEFNDVIYKNRFTSIRGTGIQAIGQNRDASGNMGLQCRCNEFVHPLVDIHVRGTLGNSLDGVRKSQGELTSTPAHEFMAGNLFSDQSTHQWDFLNEFTPNINYHHHDSLTNPNVTATPKKLVSNFNNDQLDFDEYACPMQLLVAPEGDTLTEIGYTFEEAEADFWGFTHKNDSLKDLLDDLIDGGNTWDLQAEIYFTPEHEYYQLYTDMMGEAPYLSDEVLLDLIRLENFDDLMLRNILVAHPQVPKEGELMDELENYHPNMPQYMVDDILAGLDEFGAKEVMEATLGFYRFKQFTAAHRLLEFYTTDPTYQQGSLDGVRSLLEELPYPSFRYLYVQMEIDLGNIEDAQTLLENLPVEYAMEEDDLIRHGQMEDYFDIQIAMLQSGQQWHTADSGVLSALEGISGADHPAGEWARGALALHHASTTFDREPLYVPTASPGKKEESHVFPDVPRPAGLLYPNPAQSLVTLDLGALYEAGAEVYIYGAEGTLLYKQTLNSPAEVLDLKRLLPGLYILAVEKATKRIFEKKLIILD